MNRNTTSARHSALARYRHRGDQNSAKRAVPLPKDRGCTDASASLERHAYREMIRWNRRETRSRNGHVRRRAESNDRQRRWSYEVDARIVLDRVGKSLHERSPCDSGGTHIDCADKIMQRRTEVHERLARQRSNNPGGPGSRCPLAGNLQATACGCRIVSGPACSSRCNSYSVFPRPHRSSGTAAFVQAR